MPLLSLEWIHEQRNLSDQTEYGPIWFENTSTFDDDFQKSGGDAIAMLHEMVMSRRDYTVLSDFETSEIVCAHYERYLKNRGFDIAAAYECCGEATIIPAQLKVMRDIGATSTDLLRKFCYLDIIKRKFEPENETPVFFEIGGGIGSLARVIGRHFECGTYIICDLPESLFYSFTYLNEAFPGQVFLVDESNIHTIFHNLTNPWCFLLVPSHLRTKIPDIRIDLLLNTASLGEMTNQACASWFDFINTRNIGAVFLMNRFLNNWHLSHKSGNFSSVLLGVDWDIEEWVLDPEFLKSPHEEMEPNYLLLFANKITVPSQETCRCMAIKHLYEAEKSYFVMRHLSDAEAMKGRNHRPLYGGFNGPLFNFWQAARYDPTSKAVLRFIKFLTAWGPDEKEFEEIFSYFYLLFTREGSAFSSLQSARRIWLYGAGAYGRLLYKVLLENGQSIDGVFDSRATGDFEGLQIGSTDEIEANTHADDIILIASSSWREIGLSLTRQGVKARIVSFGELFSLASPPRLIDLDHPIQL